MLKTMTIVGTRPELIKMSRVIAELDQNTEHVLVHTGQNHDYELSQVFFDDLEIRKPDYFLAAVGDTPSQAIARVIEQADKVMEEVEPDAVLLYGDTNSCLSVIPAKRRKIPVFHMEAGNRCFDQRVPEELNRRVLDHLSDINLVLTEQARQYLIAEGIPAHTIIKTGSHMREVLDFYMPKIKSSKAISRLCLENKRYFVVSIHREENVDANENLRDLMETLNAIARKYSLPIIVTTHPRTKKRLELLEDFAMHELVCFHKPFGFCDYINLQINSFCVVSDSGTITEEASMLHLPAVTVRNAHERPEGMDSGTLIMSGLKAERVIDAIDLVTKRNQVVPRNYGVVGDYESFDVSKKILNTVMSYVDYINRTVWGK